MERLVDDYGVLHSVKDLTGMDELPRLEMADFYVETVHDIGSSMMILFLIAAVIFSTIYADEGSTRMDRIIRIWKRKDRSDQMHHVLSSHDRPLSCFPYDHCDPKFHHLPCQRI